jgi:hypothetical protein
MKFGWEVFLEPLPRFGYIGHRIYVALRRHDGSLAIVEPPLTLRTLEQHSFMVPEDALIDDSKSEHFESRLFLQAMADAAWDAGIRPTQMRAVTDEMTATKYHLEDMRRLVGVTGGPLTMVLQQVRKERRDEDRAGEAGSREPGSD